MPPARRAHSRRLVLLLLGLLFVVGAGVALPVTSLGPGNTTAAAESATSYDRGVRAGECILLGRTFTPGLGCVRNQCVPGAVLWRKTVGAEACALPGQPRGYGFAATVDARHCLDLHRRWIGAVNYCASAPDRSVRVIGNAPQCIRPASVYVELAERPGRYDVCLTPAEAESLSRLAAAHGTSLSAEAARRQRDEEPTDAGPLIVGDSIAWRGGDELARVWPELGMDGEPGRRPTELGARLTAFTAQHGPPTGLVVELGTNPAQRFHRRDLAAALRTLPGRTPVLLVLPYVETSSDPVSVSAWSQRFDGWMRSVARGRPHTCVANWPAYASSHPGLLQDGIHVRHDAEGEWARWIFRQWADRC